MRGDEWEMSDSHHNSQVDSLIREGLMGLGAGAAVALIVAGAFVMIANLLIYAMLGQVNARLPEAERLSYVGFHLEKNSRIAKLYKHFYPNGPLLWISRACFFGQWDAW
jgi:hypothetical protein